MSQVKLEADVSQDGDLEKLCEDLDAYKQEFSNLINDEKEDFT